MGGGGVVLSDEVVYEPHKFRGVFGGLDTEGSIEAMPEVVTRGDGFIFFGARARRRSGFSAIGIERGLRDGGRSFRVLRGGRVTGGCSGFTSQFAVFEFLCAANLTCCHARSFGWEWFRKSSEGLEGVDSDEENFGGRS